MSQFHKAEIEKSYGRDNKIALVRERFHWAKIYSDIIKWINYQQIQRGSEYILS